MLAYHRCLITAMLLILPQLSFATYQPITINTDGNIPTITYVNKAYAVTYTLTNTLGFDMPTPLTIEKTASSADFVITDACTGKTLLTNQSCKLIVVLTPSQTGQRTLDLLMDFAHYRIPFSEIITDSKTEVVIDKKNSIPLDPNLAVGVKYPVQLTFTNRATNPPITKLKTITHFPSVFTLDADTCNEKSELAAGKSCYIKGNVIPSHTGPIKIKATLQYTEGRPVSTKTKGSAENVVVNGEATTPLAPNIAIGIKYPVQFTFTNTSPNVSATGINFTYDFPNNFKIDGNTCKTALQHDESCYIKGNITPTKTGPINIATTLKYAEGQDVPVTTSSSAENVVVNGEATTPLAPNIAIGIKYPVQLTFTNTSKKVAATQIHFLPNFDNDFTIKTNTCQDIATLGPTTSCYVNGELLPTTPNNHTVAATLNYAEGQPVPATTSGNAENVVVNGEATTPLDPNIATGVKYPVQLTFTNTSANVTATQIHFLPNFDSNFTVNTNTCQDITTLDPTTSCYVNGELLPTTPNNHTVAATLNYAEGQPVPATTSGSAENVVVKGEKTRGLNPNIAADVEYPVQFTFINTSVHVAATDLKLTTSFPEGFTEDKNTCLGKTDLPANTSCYISGTFKTNKEGPVSIKATLHYKEGQPVPVETSANAENVVVDGEIEKLPDNIEKDTTYPISFTFRNTNSTLAATNVQINKNFPTGFTKKIDTCNKDTLSSNGTCKISGNFKPTANGPVTLSATLSYKEGIPVPLISRSNVTDVNVTGTVATPLPADYISSAQIYPVVFKFTNSNNLLSAANIQITKIFPAGFAEKVDTCNKTTLPPSSTCEISGDFKAITKGPVTLSATLTYKEGSPVTKETSSTIFTFSPPSVAFTSNTFQQANLDELYKQMSLSGSGQRIGYAINSNNKNMCSGPTTYQWNYNKPNFANTTKITALDNSGKIVAFKVWNDSYYMNSYIPTLNGSGFPQTRLYLQPADYDALPTGTTAGTLYFQAYWWNEGWTYDFRVNYSIKK